MNNDHIIPETIFPLDPLGEAERPWSRRDLLDFLQMHVGWGIGTPETLNLFSVLRIVGENEYCTSRESEKEHVTVSGWVVDECWEKALFIRHRKLNRWLPPGGHADGRFNLLREALRECVEETGLKSVKAVAPYVFDIDIHAIPPWKGEKGHTHLDVRFLFQARSDELFRVAGNEISDIKWVPFSEFRKDPELTTARMSRMIQKCYVLPPIFKDVVRD